jgi:hypothetical protein
MTGRTDRIALDIETIPTVADPAFDNPDHWVPFATALGYSPAGRTDVDVEVFFREDYTLEAEAELLNSSIDWIADRINGDGELLTYNGSSYDLPILKHRGRELRRAKPGVNVIERLVLLLDTVNHVDLIELNKDRLGYYKSLEDTLEEFSIEYDEPYWLDKPITGADMPEMGLELIADRPDGVNDDLRAAVRRYAASDVGPLFELDDCIKREKESLKR